MKARIIGTVTNSKTEGDLYLSIVETTQDEHINLVYVLTKEKLNEGDNVMIFGSVINLDCKYVLAVAEEDGDFSPNAVNDNSTNICIGRVKCTRVDMYIRNRVLSIVVEDLDTGVEYAMEFYGALSNSVMSVGSVFNCRCVIINIDKKMPLAYTVLNSLMCIKFDLCACQGRES